MEKTEFKEWVDSRAAAVRSQYTTYDVLVEYGFAEAIPDNNTPTQISCPVHGPDNRPSTRYYPSDGARSDHIHCYTCKLHADSIILYAKFKGLEWYDALKDLERRFGIKIPKRPDGTPIEEPKNKNSSVYESEEWGNVPNLLVILEKKLSRIRDKVTMGDYIKFCKVIDNVIWDLDHTQQVVTPDMVQILKKTHDKMNQLISVNLEL